MRKDTALPEPLDSSLDPGSERWSIPFQDLPPRARLVDIRSPSEFAEDHVPGSRSVPLLDDQERAVVGTLYRHAGPSEASRWGVERVGRRLDRFLQNLRAALYRDGPVSEEASLGIIICARGGQRSERVTAYLRSIGWPVYRLRGGYRAYRRHVRERLALANPPGPVVLNGLTGTGKTRVLRRIQSWYPDRVVDLEGLAQHRSSLFGDIGLEPVSQKCFESRLAARLGSLEGPWTLFEWEARRIGNRELPASLYRPLLAAPQIMLAAPLERRVEILVSEYLGEGDRAAIAARLTGLRRYDSFGEEKIEELRRDLAAGRVERVAKELLVRHYDPRYLHGNRGRPVRETFPLETVEETARAIVSWIDSQSGGSGP